MKDRKRARELAAEFSRKGDPTGWFEVLYREAEEGKSTVPWADYHPTPHLIGFWMQYPQQAAGKSALVAGCGLGDDAEQLARWGFRTTAFDISATAIGHARKLPQFPSGLSDRRSAEPSRALARPVRFCFRSEHAPGLARRASSAGDERYRRVSPPGRPSAPDC